MSALTSLLVRDQVVSVRKIEEAIQRQVMGGGDLESVLLEMDTVPENVMAAYRAALHGLLPATREEVMRVPRETVKLVPREVAEQYRLVPLWAEGRTLVVAVTEPLGSAVDEQLSFLLGHDLVYRIVTEVRLAAALGHHYGSDVQPRMRRLAEKLRQRDAGSVPYVAPPQQEKVDRTVSDLPSKRPSLLDLDDEDEDEEGEGDDTPDETESGRTTRQFGIPQRKPTPIERPRPGPATAQVGVGRVVGIGPDSGAHRPAPASTPPAKPTPERRRKSVRPAHPLMRKLRGPLTAKAALEVLGEAASRDEIIEVFFAFGRQFFDYAALFVVHEDVADGRDAWGPGASADDVVRVAVPLDVPGTFKLVRDGGQALVRDLGSSELDALVAKDLRREEAQPAIVVPVTIRGRTVLLMYGDRAGERFDPSDVPELLGFVPRVSEAFEKLILKKKFRGYGGSDDSLEAKSALKAAAGRVALETLTDARQERAAADYRPSTETKPRPAREGPLGVLGVPRSAPPPPMPSRAPSRGRVDKTTRPDGSAANAAAVARTQKSPHPSAPEPGDDEPEIQVEQAASDDPDLEGIEEQEQEPEDHSPLVDGAYSMREASTEVVRRGGRRPSRPPTDRPPGRRAAHASRRADPRREEEGGSVIREVVRLPRGASIEVPRSNGAGARDVGEESATRHPTPPPSTPSPNEPSVIVDMGDTIESLVDDLVQCGPDDEGAAVDALLHVGEASLPALVQRFPGPLWFDRRQPHRRLPRGRDISAVARGIVRFGERAVPYIASLLGSRDTDTRFYVTLLAAELVSRDLLVPLSQRIFDEDPGTRLLVLDVLRLFAKYDKDMEEILKGIRVEARVDRKDVQHRVIAIRALGELRDARSAALLVQLLESPQQDVARAAHRALVTVTRQDFGDNQRKWHQWLERNSGRHRIEWLIDGLVHPDESVRAAAGDELKSITQEYYGYHPQSPKRDREIAQRKYRLWWEDEGRRRFPSR